MKNFNDLFNESPKFLKTIFSDSSNELLAMLGEYKGIMDENFLQYIPNCFKYLQKPNSYNTLAFNWLESFEKLVYLADILKEYKDTDEHEKDEIEDLKLEVFDFFEASEFFDDFFKHQSQGKDIWEFAADHLSIKQNHLLAFFHLHLNKDEVGQLSDMQFEKPVIYLMSSDLGDNALSLTINKKSYKAPDTRKFLMLEKIKNNQIYYRANNKVDSLELVKKQNRFTTEEFDFYVPEIFENNTLEEITEKSKQALSIIKEYSPFCFNFMKKFSTHFLYIKEAGVVSYSMQNLPGHSFINFFDRDNVDLVDDLVHENGHHMLNSLLIQDELIEEDDDKVFYSPWRRSLRPIRGIYHAYCTFYWALKLFADIFEGLPLKNNFFSSQDYSKIYHRLYEEYLFLKETEIEMEKAIELNKVTKNGIKVYNVFKSSVEEQSKNFSAVEKLLQESTDPLDKKRLQETDKTLKDMATYRKQS